MYGNEKETWQSAKNTKVESGFCYCHFISRPTDFRENGSMDHYSASATIPPLFPGSLQSLCLSKVLESLVECGKRLSKDCAQHEIEECRRFLASFVASHLLDALTESLNNNRSSDREDESGNLFAFSVLCNERLSKLNVDSRVKYGEKVLNSCITNATGLTSLTLNNDLCSNETLRVLNYSGRRI